MNPFSGLLWLGRAMLGRSVVFAAVFALTLMGLAVVSWVRYALGWIGLPWWVLLIVPGIALGWAAKREEQWIPDPAVRTTWARGLALGAIVASLVMAWLTPAAPPPEEARPDSPRPHGPPGR